MTKHFFNQHLIIISLDALNAHDINILKLLPNFKGFIEEGAYIKEVTSVYPSVTYTCHTSIITGTYPDKHGIYSNEKVQPHRSTLQEWYWFKKDIQVPTLFDYANKAGLITANVLWPVMASAPIKYNFPEIWSDTGQSYFSLYFKHATKNTLPIIAKYASKFKGKEQPYLDNFVECLGTELIRKKKPHLLSLHFIELDHARHVMGLKGEHVNSVLERLDNRIGNLIQATRKAGIYENTTFVLLGDHGSTDFDQVVYLNTYFEKEGLLKIDSQNNVIDWYAYANSCGGSEHIHVNKQCDAPTRQKIFDVLGKLTVMPNTFVKKIYSKEEVKEKYHLSGDFDYVIEPKDGFIFRNGINEPWIRPRHLVKDCLFAEHGQEPSHQDLKTVFFAMGNKIKKGVQLDSACIVDEGPTLAKILGLSMDNVDGNVLDEILI